MVELFVQPFYLKQEERKQLNGAEPRLGGLTCMNGFCQCGRVLRGQQRPVIAGLALQLFLCATGCHPDPGAVLAGHAFAYVPFHFEKDLFYLHEHKDASKKQRECCAHDPSPVRFFSMCGLSCRSLDHLRDLLLSTATYWFIISL